MENVWPLINALETLGVDPVNWARDPDFAPFYWACAPLGGQCIRTRLTRLAIRIYCGVIGSSVGGMSNWPRRVVASEKMRRELYRYLDEPDPPRYGHDPELVRAPSKRELSLLYGSGQKTTTEPGSENPGLTK
jgi:hypothetical protein